MWNNEYYFVNMAKVFVILLRYHINCSIKLWARGRRQTSTQKEKQIMCLINFFSVFEIHPNRLFYYYPLMSWLTQYFFIYESCTHYQWVSRSNFQMETKEKHLELAFAIDLLNSLIVHIVYDVNPHCCSLHRNHRVYLHITLVNRMPAHLKIVRRYIHNIWKLSRNNIFHLICLPSTRQFIDKLDLQIISNFQQFGLFLSIFICGSLLWWEKLLGRNHVF